MPKSGCKICRFWEKHHFKVSERELFNKKCREGTSLRKLELLLEAYGLKAKKDTIRKHISICMNLEVKQQRTIEKAIQTAKKPFQKLSKYFINPDLAIPSECEHRKKTFHFNTYTERVEVVCLECNKVLTDFDPEKRRRNPQRDLLIYASLRRRR